MATADGFLENSAVEKLLRAVSRKMSEQLSLTLSIQATQDARILKGIVGPTDATQDTIMQFIADPRVFRVKMTFAKNVNNLSQKRALIKRRCPRFIVSMREMEKGNIEYLAQDITDNVADILVEIFKLDLFPPKA